MTKYYRSPLPTETDYRYNNENRMTWSKHQRLFLHNNNIGLCMVATSDEFFLYLHTIFVTFSFKTGDLPLFILVYSKDFSYFVIWITLFT